MEESNVSWLACRLNVATRSITRALDESKRSAWWEKPLYWVAVKTEKAEQKRLVKALMATIRGLSAEEKKETLRAILSAGDALQKASKFELASDCYTIVLQTLDHDDQDIRLLALVGIIECFVSEDGLGNMETEIGRQVKDWAIKSHKLFVKAVRLDLHVTSPEVQADIKSRLARVEIKLGTLELKVCAGKERSVFNREGGV